MAAKDPNIIDKSERKIIICCQDVMALSKAENVTRTKARVSSADADWAEAATLSQMALRALRSTLGITTVLVGMRQESYVDDVIEELGRVRSQVDLRLVESLLGLLFLLLDVFDLLADGFMGELN